MLYGLNMDRPLLLSGLVSYAARNHGSVPVVSRDSAGVDKRSNWSEIDERSQWFARSLAALGVGRGDRVATIAWNDHRHLECYYGIAGSGAVLHTVNPRLFDDQLAYIVNHAEDTVVCVDPQFVPMATRLRDQCPGVKHWIVLGPTDAGLDGALAYDDLVAAHAGTFDWPELDEREAAALCYTSGTTGNPKGVLYHHRGLMLQAMTSCMIDGHGINSQESVLVVVPMFHVNGWALPFSTAMSGAKVVLPGPDVAPATIVRWIADEGITWSAGVPTVWLGAVQELERAGGSMPTLGRLAIGGSAAPPALVEVLEDRYGVSVSHVWGMTEMTLGTSGRVPYRVSQLPVAERRERQMRSGREICGVELRVVDEAGADVPRDGASPGELLCRGPWVAGSYYRVPPGDSHTDDGWLRTGDVATIDGDGYIQLVDRLKDMIKSGGEWISSIELENAAVGCAGVAEAAVIGLAHPRWQERPFMVVVRSPGSSVTADEVRAHLESLVAKWWLPDQIVFVDEIPHTGTGKIQKTALRLQFADHQLPG